MDINMPMSGIDDPDVGGGAISVVKIPAVDAPVDA
jgi:hypothetical protein